MLDFVALQPEAHVERLGQADLAGLFLDGDLAARPYAVLGLGVDVGGAALDALDRAGPGVDFDVALVAGGPGDGGSAALGRHALDPESGVDLGEADGQGGGAQREAGGLHRDLDGALEHLALVGDGDVRVAGLHGGDHAGGADGGHGLVAAGEDQIGLVDGGTVAGDGLDGIAAAHGQFLLAGVDVKQFGDVGKHGLPRLAGRLFRRFLLRVGRLGILRRGLCVDGRLRDLRRFCGHGIRRGGFDIRVRVHGRVRGFFRLLHGGFFALCRLGKGAGHRGQGGVQIVVVQRDRAGGGERVHKGDGLVIAQAIDAAGIHEAGDDALFGVEGDFQQCTGLAGDQHHAAGGNLREGGSVGVQHGGAFRSHPAIGGDGGSFRFCGGLRLVRRREFLGGTRRVVSDDQTLRIHRLGKKYLRFDALADDLFCVLRQRRDHRSRDQGEYHEERQQYADPSLHKTTASIFMYNLQMQHYRLS